jgi:hypothetical protein
MSSALDAFRAQRDAIDAVHARVLEASKEIRTLTAQVDGLIQNRLFRDFLSSERAWLDAAERFVAEVRRLREDETRRFWPAVWRRWVVAVVFALLTAVAVGAGYAWIARPGDAERAALRARGELLDAVAERVLAMTPAERRQFDALMKLPAAPK